MVIILFEIEKRPEADSPEYRAALKRMEELVESMPGYISSEDFTGEDGREINLVRFESLEALDAWHKHPEHVQIQKRARESYYASYHVGLLTTVLGGRNFTRCRYGPTGKTAGRTPPAAGPAAR